MDPKRIGDLATSRWVANVVFPGHPGMGKNHLAIPLGVEAIRNGYLTLFVGTQALISYLIKTHHEGAIGGEAQTTLPVQDSDHR